MNKILLMMFVLLMVPAVLALEVQVNCPDTVQANTQFACDIILPQSPTGGLSGMSFTLDSSATVNSVSYEGLTAISNGPKYAFLALDPITSSGKIGTVRLTASAAGNIQLKGIVANTADYEEISANQIISPVESFSFQSVVTPPPPECAPGSEKINGQCTSIISQIREVLKNSETKLQKISGIAKALRGYFG